MYFVSVLLTAKYAACYLDRRSGNLQEKRVMYCDSEGFMDGLSEPFEFCRDISVLDMYDKAESIGGIFRVAVLAPLWTCSAAACCVLGSLLYVVPLALSCLKFGEYIPPPRGGLIPNW